MYLYYTIFRVKLQQFRALFHRYFTVFEPLSYGFYAVNISQINAFIELQKVVQSINSDEMLTANVKDRELFGFHEIPHRISSDAGKLGASSTFNAILSIIDSFLLFVIASISAGGGQSKKHHNILLTGGDGCHRPVLICPCFHIYQSRILGDVVFNLKNTFLNIKNSDEVTWFSSWSLLLLNRFLSPCNDDDRDFR